MKLSLVGEGGRNIGAPWKGIGEGVEMGGDGNGGTGGISSSVVPSARKNWLLWERVLTAERVGEGLLSGLVGTSSSWPSA